MPAGKAAHAFLEHVAGELAALLRTVDAAEALPY
jgi:hypothetical protein